MCIRMVKMVDKESHKTACGYFVSYAGSLGALSTVGKDKSGLWTNLNSY